MEEDYWPDGIIDPSDNTDDGLDDQEEEDEERERLYFIRTHGNV